MVTYGGEYEYEGKVYSLSTLAKTVGIPCGTLHYRIHWNGMTVEQAVAKGKGNKKCSKIKMYEYHGIMLSMEDICKQAGISDSTFRDRLHRGWSVEDAADIPAGMSRHTWNSEGLTTALPSSGALKGVVCAEDIRCELAAKIARQVIPINALTEFNFRTVDNMREYAFDGDELTYRVWFSADGSRMHLVAWFRDSRPNSPLAMHRCYDVSPTGKIKERIDWKKWRWNVWADRNAMR